ncbi:MAG TPA: hypothetical protein G4O08_03645, partial [Anaerolineae bacterium]|nr:hypothetical protein [Anaerolineae bacterium]
VEIGSSIIGAVLVGVETLGISSTHALYVLWAPLHALSMGWSSEVVRSWGDPVWVRSLSPIPAAPVEFDLLSPFFDSVPIAALLLAGWTCLWILWAGRLLRRRDITS